MKNFSDIESFPNNKDTQIKYRKARALHNKFLSPFESYIIDINLGLDDETNTLPHLNIPILAESIASPMVFIDLRPYKRKIAKDDTLLGLTVPNTEKDGQILLAKLLLEFDKGDKLVPIRIELTKSLSFFLYSILEKVLLLNDLDKSTILPAITSYVLNMADENIDREVIHHIIKKEHMLVEDENYVLDVIGKVKEYPSTIQGFVDYLKEVDETGKFSNFNVQVLSSFLSTTTFGNLNKRLVIMSLEHLLPWLALLDIHDGNTLLKRTTLTTYLQNSKKLTNYKDAITYMNKVLKE